MHDFISVHKTGFRLLKKIYDLDHAIIPTRLLEIFFSLLSVYGGLFWTAALVDLLLAAEFARAALCAGGLLLWDLAFGIANHIIRRKFCGQENRLWLSFYVWLREKAFSLDYETMEKPEVSEKILFSERTSDMYGGLGSLLNHYCELLRAVLDILLSVCLVIRLCMTMPDRTASLPDSLACPLPSLLLFTGMLAGMIGSSCRIFQHYAARQQALFDSHTGVESKIGYLLGQIFGNADAGKIIRLYDMKEMLMENAVHFTHRSNDFFRNMVLVERAEGDAHKAANGIFTIGSYLLVALKTVTGAITVGAFTRYAGALNRFGSACYSFLFRHGEMRKITSTMEQFLAFLELENAHATGTIPVEKRADGEYELAFEHVSFCYPGSDVPVLKDINCKLSIHGKLAVVGKNGAGKTTFIKLLCRLYEPTEGRTTLNGVDIRKYDEAEYHSLFGVVFQDFRLFSLPIGENITAGYERHEMRLQQALEQADALSLAESLPQKLDTMLHNDWGDGVELSGGEAQKIALARALYKDAPVVVLDEPTAALDPKAEAEIYAHFNQMVEGRTSIYISHRMSSCRFCDDIIVFEDGKIAERGSHEALLSAGGCYARLWEAQAKYYVERRPLDKPEA